MLAKKKRNKKGSLKTTLGYIAFGIISIFIVGFLFITNVKIYQKRSDLSKKAQDLRAQVQTLEQEKKDLEKDLSNKESEEYKEEVARNQLDMKKPGEEVYVVQKEPVSEQHSGESGQEKSWWEKIKSIFIK